MYILDGVYERAKKKHRRTQRKHLRRRKYKGFPTRSYRRHRMRRPAFTGFGRRRWRL